MGVSTSRGKTDKVGQFGSGTIMGVTAWLRHTDEAPVFYVNGTKCRFTVRPEIKSDGESYHLLLMNNQPTSLSLEHGAIDWTDPGMALREWISNAIDAGMELRDCLELTDTMTASADEVVVFVKYNEVAKEYFKNISKYFLHASGQQHMQEIHKDTVSRCRVYRRGVFVKELSEDSICDYNLDFSIDECRTGSSDSLMYTIKSHIRWYASKKLAEMIRDKVLEGAKTLETDYDSQDLQGEIRKAFAEMAGTTKVCTGAFLVADAVPIEYNWHRAIRKSVPDIDAVAFVSVVAMKFVIVPPTEELTQKFGRICEVFETLEMHNNKERPAFELFKTTDGVKPNRLGQYCPVSKTVSLWHENQTSTRTLVHELCHHYSGCDDHESGFADYAHETIVRVIDRLF